MRRGVTAGMLLTVVVGSVISGTLMAYADWHLPGAAAKATVVAGRMPQGVTPTAEIRNGNAVVSWVAQELRAGVKMQRYIVTAHSVDETPKPDVKHTVVAGGTTDESATFTAAELAGGKWKWAITPKFETWVGAEGRLSNPKLGFPAAATAGAPATGTTVLAGPATAAPQAAPTVSNAPVPPASATDAPPPQPVAETAPTGEATATAGPAPLRTSPPPAGPTTTAVPPPPVLPVEDDLPPPGPVVSSGPTE